MEEKNLDGVALLMTHSPPANSTTMYGRVACHDVNFCILQYTLIGQISLYVAITFEPIRQFSNQLSIFLYKLKFSQTFKKRTIYHPILNEEVLSCSSSSAVFVKLRAPPLGQGNGVDWRLETIFLKLGKLKGKHFFKQLLA